MNTTKFIYYARIIAIIAGLIMFDQYIKYIILSGFRWDGKVISIVLVFNDGVAFSMLSFLQGYLKWIQVGLLGVVGGIIFSKISLVKSYYLGLGLILGGGISNVIDRFIHKGVVDYIYWHYGFEFAIFNAADVMIDLGVGVLFLQWFWLDKRKPLQNSH